MKKHISIIVLILVAGVAIAAWCLRDKSRLASDEPPFSAIALPIKDVKGDVWMDGGSVWVGVTDSGGVSYDFIFPFDYKTEGYPTAFYGAKKVGGPGGIKLKNPARSREIVLKWLREADPNREGLGTALDYLSGDNYSLVKTLKTSGIRAAFDEWWKRNKP